MRFVSCCLWRGETSSWVRPSSSESYTESVFKVILPILWHLFKHPFLNIIIQQLHISIKKPTQSLKVEEAGKHLSHVAFTWHITLWDFNRTKYQPAEMRVWGFPSQGEARYRRHLLTRSPKPFRSLKIKHTVLHVEHYILYFY